MKKLIFAIVFILILFPTSQSFSQEYTDTKPTLTVTTNSDANYVYQDSEGYTVVIGVIENNDPLSFVTNVKVQAYFYDEFSSNPLEVKEGKTVLNVIPPLSSSPFIIHSDNPNSNISDVYTKILTFETSEFQKNSLGISINDVSADSVDHSSDSSLTFSFSGILRNGDSPISDTFVHLAFYDVFHRIIQVSTIDIGDVEMNALTSIKINEEINSSSIGFLLISESNKFYSDMINVKILFSQSHKNPVIISDVTVRDTLGRIFSEIKKDSTVRIQSQTMVNYENVGKWNETPYTYYVQIKESSSNPESPPQIEYIGKYDGKFLGNGIKLQSINWIPESEGLFFIETYIWDENNVPLANPGPFVQILVN